MNIEVRKGYRDTIYIEYDGSLFLADCTIEKPTFRTIGGDYFTANINVEFNQELKEKLKEAGINDTPSVHYSKSVSLVGKRKDKQEAYLAEQLEEFKATFTVDKVNKLVKERLYVIKDEIVKHVEYKNRQYKQEALRVYSGEQLSTSFVEENLKTPAEDAEIEALELAIQSLKEKEKEAYLKRQKSRNEQMLAFVQKNDTNLPKEIDDEVKALYAENKAFTVSFSPFGI